MILKRLIPEETCTTTLSAFLLGNRSAQTSYQVARARCTGVAICCKFRGGVNLKSLWGCLWLFCQWQMEVLRSDLLAVRCLKRFKYRKYCGVLSVLHSRRFDYPWHTCLLRQGSTRIDRNFISKCLVLPIDHNMWCPAPQEELHHQFDINPATLNLPPWNDHHKHEAYDQISDCERKTVFTKAQSLKVNKKEIATNCITRIH